MKNTVRLGSVVLSLAFAGALFAQDAAPAATTPAAEHPAHAQFSSLDKDKDGRVSQTEAQTDDQLKSAFATLDTDNDRYLSTSEFAKWGTAEK